MHPDLNETKDVFTWKGLKIYQGEDVLKVGTDAILLGSWISKIIPFASSVLDAGTGTGILAMIAASYFPEARIYAVDIDEQAVALANFNVMHAGLESRITVIKSDLLEETSFMDVGFDLIICNPPFYTNRVLPKQEFNARSKHSAVPVSEWTKQLLANMREEGQLCLIVPSEEAHHWIGAANAFGYYNQHRTDVYSFASDPMAKRSLLHFTAQLCKPEFDRLVLYSEDKNYTSEYLMMSGIKPMQIRPR